MWCDNKFNMTRMKYNCYNSMRVKVCNILFLCLTQINLSYIKGLTFMEPLLDTFIMSSSKYNSQSQKNPNMITMCPSRDGMIPILHLAIII